MSFQVTFQIDLCKGCELCVAYCPQKLLTTDKQIFNRNGVHPVTIMDTTRCIGCLSCVMMCPDAIIRIEKQEQ